MARVGRGAFLLGFAGLLPQVAAVVLVAAGHRAGGIDRAIAHGVGQALALGYAALILSFLGGMWWGFAMRRDTGQGRLTATAVVPSLVAAALIFGPAARGQIGWALVGLGSALLLTLLVDRHLVRTGEAPTGWMRLRIPLSVGLGGLTILAGVIAQGPVQHF